MGDYVAEVPLPANRKPLPAEKEYRHYKPIEDIHWNVPHDLMLVDVIGNGNCGYYSIMLSLRCLRETTDVLGNDLPLEDLVEFRKALYKFTINHIDVITQAQDWGGLGKCVGYDMGVTSGEFDSAIGKEMADNVSHMYDSNAEHLYENPFWFLDGEDAQYCCEFYRNKLDPANYLKEGQQEMWNACRSADYWFESDRTGPCIASMLGKRLIIYQAATGIKKALMAGHARKQM